MTHRAETTHRAENNFFWIGLALLVTIIISSILVIYMMKDKNTTTYGDWSSSLSAPKDVTVSMDENNNSIVFSKNGDDDSKRVELFEDFSCPHCADLSTSIDPILTDKLSKGEYSVQLYMMNFMDKNTGLTFSTDTNAALIALAEGNYPKSAWQFYTMVWENQEQMQTVNKKEIDSIVRDLIQANNEGNMDRYNERMEKKVDERYVQLHSNAYMTELDNRVGQVSTPHVFVDGSYIDDPLNYSW